MPSWQHRMRRVRAVHAPVLVVAALGATYWDWPTILRAPLGIYLICYAPGRAVFSALFPQGIRGDSPRIARTDVPRELLELVFSVGISLACVALVGLGLFALTGTVEAAHLLLGISLVFALGFFIDTLRPKTLQPRKRSSARVKLSAIELGLILFTSLVVLIAGWLAISGPPPSNETGVSLSFDQHPASQVEIGTPIRFDVRVTVSEHTSESWVMRVFLVPLNSTRVEPTPRLTTAVTPGTSLIPFELTVEDDPGDYQLRVELISAESNARMRHLQSPITILAQR